MPTIKDDAICIRHWDWSETSQTVSILTREHGIVRGLAKGAKRENARFSGGLELATRGELLAIVKSDDAHQSLATLTSWDLAETFPGARRTLDGFLASMAMLDFVHHGLIERDAHPEIFDALVSALRRLDTPGQVHIAALGFAWTLIDATGHRPELFVNLQSAALLNPATLYAFDPRRGALIADTGAQQGASSSKGAAAPPVWRVRGETVDVLRQLAQGATLEETPLPAAPTIRALKLLCFYFRELVGTQPTAIRAMLDSLPTAPGA